MLDHFLKRELTLPRLLKLAYQLTMLFGLSLLFANSSQLRCRSLVLAARSWSNCTDLFEVLLLFSRLFPPLKF